jgi:hypothetical protein
MSNYNKKMLAKSHIYTGDDGKHYLLIQLTDAIPTAENTEDLYKLIDYIPTLDKMFTVIIDTKEAQALYYLQYFATFLNRLSQSSGTCVEHCEVWVQPYVGPMLSFINVMIHETLRTNGYKIEIKFFD